MSSFKNIKISVSIDKWRLCANKDDNGIGLDVSDRLSPVETFHLERATKKVGRPKKKAKKHGNKSAASVPPASSHRVQPK